MLRPFYTLVAQNSVFFINSNIQYKTMIEFIENSTNSSVNTKMFLMKFELETNREKLLTAGVDMFYLLMCVL